MHITPAVVLLSLAAASAAASTAKPPLRRAAPPPFPKPLDLLAPVSVDPPLGIFTNQAKHPCAEPKQEIQNACHIPDGGGGGGAGPMHTNKYYQNFVMGFQNSTVFPLPYGIRWDDGVGWSGPGAAVGMGVVHHDPDERVFVKSPSGNYSRKYYLPIGDPALINFSAKEFSKPTFSTSRPTDQFCLNVTLSSSGGGALRMPVCQGMAFATAVYNNKLTPRMLIRAPAGSTSHLAAHPEGRYLKLKVSAKDKTAVLVYIFSGGKKWAQGDETQVRQVGDMMELVMKEALEGGYVIQAAKVSKASNNQGDDEALYDRSAGWYPGSAALSSMTLKGPSTGSYAISYYPESVLKGEVIGEPLVFGMPHHIASLSGPGKGKKTGLQLASRVTGPMTAISHSELEMTEDSLPHNVGFGLGAAGSISAGDKEVIKNIVRKEVAEDLTAKNAEGTYFKGKKLTRSAYICLSAWDALRDQELTKQCLEKVKAAFEPFTKNQASPKLFYDQMFGGIVSDAYFTTTGAQPLKINADFGNMFYNDHHFHYSYFIHAGAVVAHLEGEISPKGSAANDTAGWASKNKDYINSFVRETANPSPADKAFAQFRNFDWYHGHSWAAGLYEFGDGRNEESSSEDYNFAYGMKLWGAAIKDKNIEGRGNLMLAVLRKSLNMYMLVGSKLSVQPEQIKPNFACGILWENLVDFATWFSPNVEAIQGIHMIPTTPISAYIRDPEFSKREWEATYAGSLDKMPANPWKSIWAMNVATFAPDQAWGFFSNPAFDKKLLDDGLSQSWALAFSASMKSSKLKI